MTAVPILRTSERRAFKSCQAKWWWSYREGLKPIGAERTPLWFGTGFHLALAEWYIPGTKRGVHPSETWAKYAKDSMHSIKVADATEELVAQYEDGVKLGEVLTQEYVKVYGQDGSWDFIQAEQTFSLDVPWPGGDRQSLYTVDESSGVLVAYKGTYDGVYRDLADGKIKLLETKTARALRTNHLSLDDQAGSYWAVAGRTLRSMNLIGPKERIHGITYNFIRKGLPDERPKDAQGYYTNKPVKADYVAALEDVVASHSATTLTKLKLDSLQGIADSYNINVLGERSKVQPPPLFLRVPVWRTAAEQRSQLIRIQDEAVQMQAVRDGSVAVTKNPQECSFCDYFQMCELQERGGDWKDYRRIAYRVEDPYADHRKSSDE